MPLGATTEYNRSSQSQAPLSLWLHGPRDATLSSRQYATHPSTHCPRAIRKMVVLCGPLVVRAHWAETRRARQSVRTHMSRTRASPRQPHLDLICQRAETHELLRPTLAQRRTRGTHEEPELTLYPTRTAHRRRSTTQVLACHADPSDRSHQDQGAHSNAASRVR
jgi:hypothetical protein